MGGFGVLTGLIGVGRVWEMGGLFVRIMGYGVWAGDPLQPWGVGVDGGRPAGFAFPPSHQL